MTERLHYSDPAEWTRKCRYPLHERRLLLYQNLVAIPLSVSGALTTSSTATSTPMPFNGEIVAVYGTLGTANVGADLLVNTQVAGTSQISAAANKVTFKDGDAAGTVASKKIVNTTTSTSTPANQISGVNYYATSAFPAPLSLGTFTAGQTIGLKVDQIGSGTAGSALSATVLVRVA